MGTATCSLCNRYLYLVVGTKINSVCIILFWKRSANKATKKKYIFHYQFKKNSYTSLCRGSCLHEPFLTLLIFISVGLTKSNTSNAWVVVLLVKVSLPSLLSNSVFSIIAYFQIVSQQSDSVKDILTRWQLFNFVDLVLNLKEQIKIQDSVSKR